MKFAIWFDFHDTIVNSTKAWLKAYRGYCSIKQYKKIKKMYKQGVSRKKIALLLKVDYLMTENEYRKNLKPKKFIFKLFEYCIDKFEVLIISNAPRERLLKDFNKIHLNCGKIKVYTKEDGQKPDTKYIDDIIKQNGFQRIIMIGDNKFEDKLNNIKIKSIIINNIFSEVYAFLVILYSRFLINRRKNDNNVKWSK